jgi:multiple sugar transport system substrate-binding protein
MGIRGFVGPFRYFLRFAAGMATTLALAASSLAGPIVINTNTSDPAPLAAFVALIDWFRAEHPADDVTVNYYNQEAYKTALRGWLTSTPPDVILWNAGNRMRELAADGLLTDVSDLWTPELRAKFNPGAIDLVSNKDRQYGVPYTSYAIGLYVRRDRLSAAGISDIADWKQLVAACETLKAAGDEPIVLGSRDLWPAAGWFDYIDLRLNGADFHQALTAGFVPYTDPRVVQVFDLWRQLIDNHCFTAEHTTLSWQDAQEHLYSGRGVMMLIGGFVTPNFPAALREDVDLIPFPVIDPAIFRAEETPMNSAHVPARAPNPEGGKAFLAFMSRADVQGKYNADMNTLPVNRESKVGDDKYLMQNQEIIASAVDLTQYFDRDTDAALATVAMRGFQDFMVTPDHRDQVIADIEKARLEIYGR